MGVGVGVLVGRLNRRFKMAACGLLVFFFFFFFPPGSSITGTCIIPDSLHFITGEDMCLLPEL